MRSTAHPIRTNIRDAALSKLKSHTLAHLCRCGSSAVRPRIVLRRREGQDPGAGRRRRGRADRCRAEARVADCRARPLTHPALRAGDGRRTGRHIAGTRPRQRQPPERKAGGPHLGNRRIRDLCRQHRGIDDRRQQLPSARQLRRQQLCLPRILHRGDGKRHGRTVCAGQCQPQARALSLPPRR